MTPTVRSTYIAYIDGMRAFAVLAVMLYHMDASLLPGGFVGVDVFFVISGFVVSASLAGHGQEGLGKFLGHFYARRLARLIPALVAMLVTATLLYVLLVPKAWFNRAAETVGQAAFWGLSNWVLHGHSFNYCEPRAEFNPFTHTWSLGVEEQFYLIAPMLLFMALRKPATQRHRRAVILVMAALAALSLLAYYHVSITQGARAAFYLLPFRFWELALGVVWFLLLPGIRVLSVRFGNGGRLSGGLGLSIIAVAMLVPHSSAYPYLRSTVAVLGALLLISAAHAHPQDTIRRALASAAAVWVGRRSYALYLWHWPVFVLARWTVGLEVWPFNVVAAALSFLLAAISYKVIEHPFRTSVRLRARPAWMRIGICLSLMALGWAAARTLLELQPVVGLGRVTREAGDWYPDRGLLKNTLAAQRRCEPLISAIAVGNLMGAGTSYIPRDCPARPQSQLFVIGDSHAVAYRPMLEQVSAEHGRMVTIISTPGCSYMDLKAPLTEASDPTCHRIARRALAAVLERAHPGDVVFLPSLRLPRLIELGGARRQPTAVTEGEAPDLFALTASERLGLQQALEDASRWIEPLVNAGLRVILEAPKPVFKAHPFSCVEVWNRTNPACSGGLEVSRDDMERYRAPVMQSLRTLAERYAGITIWDPLPELCDETRCSALRNGRPLFFDGDHLSPYGNLVLLPAFKASLHAVEAR